MADRKLDPKIEERLWTAIESAPYCDGLALEDDLKAALEAITALKGMLVEMDQRLHDVEEERSAYLEQLDNLGIGQ